MTPLIKEILYANEIGCVEDIDFLLDPTKSALMYKHIKNKLPTLPVKYAIKVKESYFPRLFNGLNEALDFACKAKEEDLTDANESIFIRLTIFELFSIEEI